MRLSWRVILGNMNLVHLYSRKDRTNVATPVTDIRSYLQIKLDMGEGRCEWDTLNLSLC